MNPELLQFLMPLLSKSLGNQFGAAGGTLANNIQGFFNNENMSRASSRLNVDPVRDINAFRVNPFRGFLAQQGLRVKAAPTAQDTLNAARERVIGFEWETGGPGGTRADYRNKADIFDEIVNVQKKKGYGSAINTAKVADWLWRAGWDIPAKKQKINPKAYIIGEYIRKYEKYDPKDFDAEWGWTGRKKYSEQELDKMYEELVSKLPENEQQLLINNAQDWFYKNRWPDGYTPKRDKNGRPIRDKYGAIHPDYANVWARGIRNMDEDKVMNPVVNLDKDGLRLSSENEVDYDAYYRNATVPKKQQGGSIKEYQKGKSVGAYSWSQGTPSIGIVNNPTEYSVSTPKSTQKSINKQQEDINSLAKKLIKKSVDQLTDDEYNLLSQSTLNEKDDILKKYRIYKADQAKLKSDSWSNPQTFADVTSAIGDKLSLQNLPGIGKFIPNFLDVTGGIGQMASGLGQIPLNISQGNYGQAAFNLGLPLVTGAVGGMGAKTTGQFLNNLVNPLDGIGDFGHQLMGELAQGAANRKAIQKGNEWSQYWIDHPATKNRITNSIDKVTFPTADIDLINMLRDIKGRPPIDSSFKPDFWETEELNKIKDQLLNYKANSREYPLKDQLNDIFKQYKKREPWDLSPTYPMHRGNAGVSYRHYDDWGRREEIEKGLRKPNRREGEWISRDHVISDKYRTSATIHENTHGWATHQALVKTGLYDMFLDGVDSDVLNKLNKRNELLSQGKDPKKHMSKQDLNMAYLVEPTEQHARLMQLREEFKLKPGEFVDEDRATFMLDRILSGKTNIDKKFSKVLNNNPERLADLLNKAWVAVPAIGAVGLSQQNTDSNMENYQQGGQVDEMQSPYVQYNYQFPSLGVLPGYGMVGTPINDASREAIMNMALGGDVDEGGDPFGGTSAHAFPLFKKHKLIPESMTLEEFLQIPKEQLQQMMIAAGFGNKPGEVVASRPIEYHQISETETETISPEEIEREEFNKAFAKAQKTGVKVFEYKGKLYTTAIDKSGKSSYTPEKRTVEKKTELRKGNLREFAEGGSVDDEFEDLDESMKSYIGSVESDGRYTARNKKTSATGKYQHMWSIHAPAIMRLTGVKSRDEYLKCPDCQEMYQTKLNKDYYNNLPKLREIATENRKDYTDEELLYLNHHSGFGGAKKYLRTGTGADKKGLETSLKKMRQRGFLDLQKDVEESTPEFDYMNPLAQGQNQMTKTLRTKGDPYEYMRGEDGEWMAKRIGASEWKSLKGNKKAITELDTRFGSSQEYKRGGGVSGKLFNSSLGKINLKGMKGESSPGEDDDQVYMGGYLPQVTITDSRKDPNLLPEVVITGDRPLAYKTAEDMKADKLKELLAGNVESSIKEMMPDLLTSYGDDEISMMLEKFKDGIINSRELKDILPEFKVKGPGKISNIYKDAVDRNKKIFEAFGPNGKAQADNPKMAQMGGSINPLMIPSSYKLDTINNVPSNIPGGSGGNYDISQLVGQKDEAFMIPKMQPFTSPIFGNAMLDIQRPNYINPQAQFGGPAKYQVGKEVESKYVNPIKAFLQGWNNSPQGIQMLNNSVDQDDPYGLNSAHADSMREARDKMLGNIDVHYNDEDRMDGAWGRIGKWGNDGTFIFSENDIDRYRNPSNYINQQYLDNYRPYVLAERIGDDSKLQVNMFNKLKPGGKNFNETLAHEVSHATDVMGDMIPKSDMDLIGKYTKDAYSRLKDSWRKKGFKLKIHNNEEAYDFAKYLSDPTEVRARLNAARFTLKNQGLYDPYKEKATKKILNKYKGTEGDQIQQLRLIFTDDQIIDMLNKISYNDSNVDDSIQTAQLGGSVNPAQQMLGYKDGSPFGNLPYQSFNTNNLTMDGVSRPLMAFADNGMSALMQPNSGNYTFPGANRVTEVPIMQTGSRVTPFAPEEFNPFTTQPMSPADLVRTHYIQNSSPANLSEALIDTYTSPYMNDGSLNKKIEKLVESTNAGNKAAAQLQKANEPYSKPNRLVVFAEAPKKPKYDLDSEDLPKELMNIKKKFLKANYGDERIALATEFEEHPSNPKIDDPTFIKIADQYKAYAKKHGIPIEVVSGYGDEAFNKYQSKIKKGDSAVILGHSGDMIGGIGMEDWNKVLKGKALKECIGGTCNYNDSMAGSLPDVKNTMFINDQGWYGPDMSRISDPNIYNFTYGLSKGQRADKPNYIKGYPQINTKMNYKNGGPVKGDQTLIVNNDEFTINLLKSLKKYQYGGTIEEDLVYLPIQFSNGGPVEIYGIPRAGFGDFIKKVGKGIGKGVSFVGKHLKDAALIGLDNATNIAGLDLIKDGAYSTNFGKTISGLSGKIADTVGMVAAPFIPGGTLVRGIGSGANALLGGRGIGGWKQQQPQMPGMDQFGGQFAGQFGNQYGGSYNDMGSLFSMINPAFSQQSGAGMFPFMSGGAMTGGVMPPPPDQQQSGPNIQNMGGYGNALGQIPFGSGFGNPMMGGSMLGMFGGQDPNNPIMQKLNNAYAQQQGGGFGNIQDMLGRLGGSQVPTGGGQFGNLQALMGLLGGGGQMSVPGFGGGMFGLPPQRYGGSIRYQEGGEVQEESSKLIPIQTEKVGNISEMIVHLDGTITKVNATKKHSQMDEDVVTDIVPEGSYIASADKNMRIKFREAEDIVMGVKSQPYKEWKKGKVPTQLTLSEIWGGSKKDKTPAELVDNIRKKFNIIDKSEHLKYPRDIFTEQTNQENMRSRLPYVAEIVGLNEKKRNFQDQLRSAQSFKYGGSPFRVPSIPGFQPGGGVDWSKIISTAASAAPFVMSLFGKGQSKNPGQISPMVQNSILGTIPMYQMGVNQNIAAQQGALGTGISDFSALGNQLMDYARQSTAVQNQANFANTGLGLANYFGMETNLPKLDMSAARSRINNYRPLSASRSAVEAASTPNFDAQSIMEQMGARSGPVLAQLMSEQMKQQNAASQSRNSILDSAEQGKIGQLNNMDLTENQFNIGQQEKERMLREQQRGGIFGTMQAGTQRGADLQSGLLGQYGNIKSQILPITTQFNMQRAGLQGQPLMLGAQNAFNAMTVLGGLQNQASTANMMYGNKQQPFDMTQLSNIFGNQQGLDDFSKRLDTAKQWAYMNTPFFQWPGKSK